MRLSVVIPAHDEEETIGETLEGIVSTISGERIEHEVIVIDDSGKNGTAAVVGRFSADHPQVKCIPSKHPPGFGFAVRSGLEAYDPAAVAIVMAEGSDSPRDLIAYHFKRNAERAQSSDPYRFYGKRLLPLAEEPASRPLLEFLGDPRGFAVEDPGTV